MPRILVLDDQYLISMMLQNWLSELGCETVGPAGSVKRAMELLSGLAPDGAILDISLGDGDCYPVADELRNRGVPFALATGHGRNGIADRFRDSLVLPKPFNFKAVQGMVAELLDARTNHGAQRASAEQAPVEPLVE